METGEGSEQTPVDPEFQRQVEESPYYQGRNTPDGRRRMENRLGALKKLVALSGRIRMDDTKIQGAMREIHVIKHIQDMNTPQEPGE